MRFSKVKFSAVLLLLLSINSSVLKAQITSDSLQIAEVKADTVSLQPARLDTIKKKNTIWQNLKYDGLTAFGAIKHTYSRPFHWQKDDLLTAGGILAGTVLLSFADESAGDFFEDQGKKMPQSLRDFGWYFGSPQNNYGITGSVYLFGLLTDNEKIRRTGVLLISSASASGILQTVTKTVTGRARPSAGKGNMHFKPFANDSSYNSFPSGHTVLSFTTAYAIGKQFENPFARYGIYGVGLISPVSRLWEHKHWVTDVGLSLVMSVAVVECIDNYLKKEKKYHDPNKISWNFRVGAGTLGVAGVF